LDSDEHNDDGPSAKPQSVRWSRRYLSRKEKGSKYPVARMLIPLQRVIAIMIAALWPVEAIYIALGTDFQPVQKIVWILGLLLGHLLGIVSILLLAELLQAFLDIAKNTQETVELMALRTAEKIDED